MSPEPVILVLEDERSQILLLRSQLSGLGRLVEFSDPEKALAHAREHRCDAAIVDVNLPRASMDGMGFLRALREFDREISVIIRTGSEAETIADDALELKAMKRVMKLRVTLAEIRRSVRDAIRETHERRQMAENARTTETTKERLAEALGAFDLRLAAAEMNRGLLHALRNRLTALSALAAVLQRDAEESGRDDFREHVARCSELVADTVDSVNTFLDGPFGEGGTADRAAVNECLVALRQFFAGSGPWARDGKRLVVRTLAGDTRVACGPLKLTNGLRHLAEYFLVNSGPGTEVGLSAAIIQSPEEMARRLGRSGCALNRESLQPSLPYVAFRVSGTLEGVALDSVRDAFSFGLPGGRTGNLNVVGQTISSCQGAALIEEGRPGAFAVEVLFPIPV